MIIISDEPLTPEQLRAAVAQMLAAIDSRPGWPKITSDDPNDDPAELAKLLTGTANYRTEAN